MHPVQLRVERPVRMSRAQIVVRLALLLALGALGCSSVYWVVYLAVPALAALLVSEHGPRRYLDDDASRLTRALSWIAAVYGYLWLLTDELPAGPVARAVDLRIDAGGEPTTTTALLRLVYSLPALIVLAVLSVAGGLLWIVGAVAVLFVEHVPDAIAAFLALTLRYQFRLVAYHLSLVDRYPSFEDAASERGTPAIPAQ